MSELSKAYEPAQVESKWYDQWLEKKYFEGKVDESREGYSIMIPPPNVTGVLHMGHILNNTIQDILARRARQQGKSVMWMPGTDHAGIATQTRVEKELRKEGKTRHDVGREAFVEKVHEWKDKHGGIILKQLRTLGASCDWSRTTFTLDEGYSRAVLQAFVSLYEQGHIYRGKRMVNWCPVSQTALSDEEVIMKPQQGILYQMRYELVDQPGEYLHISTTRPETIMGDSGVAVHPEDERYQHLIGQQCWRPFPREPIPIVGDASVEREFGTGVLKVTPAHDKVDWEIGQRHGLAVIDVLNADGTLNDLAGEDFAGMDRFKVRKLAAKKLDELGLLIKEEPYQNNVGFSERADVVIEPRLSEQWFLKYPCVEEAKAVVAEGKIAFYPQRWTKTYVHWLDNIQDWCISRQLWWGHRIPVWYRKGADRSDAANWHVSLDGPEDAANWEQDDDVLDTWASSWLWPFATLGWPDVDEEKQKALAHWYPSSDLVTGPDIIFFWVARMIMAGLNFTEGEEVSARIPFKNVYFTGIVRDIQGRKMSKSLGNSPDPLDLVTQYGADGMRLGIMSIAPQGQDVLFSEDRVQQGRNFCNKLWNACRFRQMSGEAGVNESVAAIVGRMDGAQLDANDHAILSNLMQCISDVEKHLAEYSFNAGIQSLYGFFWNDFCDWYVEVSKAKLKDEASRGTCLAIQDLCIREVLLMMHAYIPFITEELWQTLAYAAPGEETILFVPVSTVADLQAALAAQQIVVDEQASATIADVREFITLARSLKAEYKLQNKKDVHFSCQADARAAALLADESAVLLKMAGASAIVVVEDAVEGSPAVVTPLGTLYLDLQSAIDVGAETERLGKERDKLIKICQAGEGKLKNEKFVNSAPEAIVAGARKQLAENQAKLEEVERLLLSLAG